MNELRGKIESALNQAYLDSAFPVLTRHGVIDSDVYMHSVGCSVWNTLGHELGYMAVVETPAPYGSGDNIRSDSAWFDKQGNSPRVLVEFERYGGTDACKTKLISKLCNLMEASVRWERHPGLLVLSAWSAGLVSAPDYSEIESIYRSGFVNRKGVRVQRPPYGSLLLHRIVLQLGVDGLLRLKHMNFRWLS